MTILVINDNGVRGQVGASEEYVKSAEDIPALIKEYENAGIIVYGIQ